MTFLKAVGTWSVKWQYHFSLSGAFWRPSLSQIYLGMYAYSQKICQVQFLIAEVLSFIHKDKQAYLFASVFILCISPLEEDFHF